MEPTQQDLDEIKASRDLERFCSELLQWRKLATTEAAHGFVKTFALFFCNALWFLVLLILGKSRELHHNLHAIRDQVIDAADRAEASARRADSAAMNCELRAKED